MPKGPIPRPEKRERRRLALKKLDIQLPPTKLRGENIEALRRLKAYLRETWEARLPSVEVYKRYTPKQVEFARQYALNGRTSLRKAVDKAGYNFDRVEMARLQGARLMKMTGMPELVKAFEIEEKARMKINVEDVVKWFNDIATEAMTAGDFTNANRAMENLAKYLGMFIERKEVTHR
ncbi:MAG: hypothetical protein EBZ48_15920, partial [Proteobacteria bacterium]|nr:hypothetical protein [Pseudomonadota bacterium]